MTLEEAKKVIQQTRTMITLLPRRRGKLGDFASGHGCG